MQELIDLTEINFKLIPVANLDSILNIDSQKLPKNLIKPKAQDLMEFNQSALVDLSILLSRDHPSLVIQNIMPKEGFSLFSLFDFTLL
jgi:hypothetical protein